MPANLDRRFRPRITLRQIGILVAMSAIASAVVMPQARGMGDGPQFWFTFCLTAAIELPYALMIPMLLMVRPGPAKNWMLSAMCLIPIPAAVALVWGLNYVGFSLERLFSVATLIVILVAAIPVFLIFASTSRWLVPRFCPDCRTPALLRDVTVPKSRHFPKGSESRTCLACGTRFRRSRGGPWVDVDLLEPLESLVPTKRIRYQPKGLDR